MTSINYFQGLIWRFRLAVLAFVQAPSLEPIIKLKNGAYIDLSSKKIVLAEDTHIHCEGDLIISSAKHLMLESGKGAEDREGYVNGIWFNPSKDIYGRPLRLVRVLNEKNQEVEIPLIVKNGKQIIPMGYREIL